MSPIEVPAKIQLVEKRETRTSRGMLSKGWYRVDDQLVMVKGNSITEAGTAGYEPYSEVMASLIAQVLGLPHVEYALMPAKLFPDIQTYSCDVVSVCPKFTTDDEQLYHFADLADAHFLASGRAASPEALFQYAIELYGKKWLYQMLAFDAFIGNEDRHENNFDVIVRDGTNRYLSRPRSGHLHTAPEGDHVLYFRRRRLGRCIIPGRIRVGLSVHFQ